MDCSCGFFYRLMAVPELGRSICCCGIVKKPDCRMALLSFSSNNIQLKIPFYCLFSVLAHGPRPVVLDDRFVGIETRTEPLQPAAPLRVGPRSRRGSPLHGP